jgi:hypothetical protein
MTLIGIVITFLTRLGGMMEKDGILYILFILIFLISAKRKKH